MTALPPVFDFGESLQSDNSFISDHDVQYVTAKISRWACEQSLEMHTTRPEQWKFNYVVVSQSQRTHFEISYFLESPASNSYIMEINHVWENLPFFEQVLKDIGTHLKLKRLSQKRTAIITIKKK